MSILRRFHDSSLRTRSLTGSAEGDGVLRNLRHILGSKRDYASFLPAFGLGETFHRPVTPVTLETLRQEILAQVGLHEPRLHDPQAELLPRSTDGALRFRLWGLLPSRQPLQLVVQLAGSQVAVGLLNSEAGR